MISLALTGLFLQGGAQDSAVLHLWPGKVPDSKEAKHPAVVTDNHTGDITRLTDVTDPTLTVFTPPAGRANGGSVLICPGGGYQILAIDLEGYEIARWLNSLGFTAFVLQYRVPNKRKGSLQDVQRAIRLIRARAGQWNLDPRKTGVLGFSAGGSLAARISTGYHRSWYHPVDQADSLPSRPDFTVLIYPAYLDMGPGNTLTPELGVNEQTPPMFIFQTADDPYGHSALVMADALRTAKVPVELHFYPKGGHGYGLRTGNPAGREWPPLAEVWLKEEAGNH